jgi:hypothetical protein
MNPPHRLDWVLIAAITAGCAITTPYENFKTSERLMVGTSIDLPRTNIRPELLISERPISDGVVEYRYKYLGDCVRVFAVDLKTRVILSASHAGSKTSCVISP